MNVCTLIIKLVNYPTSLQVYMYIHMYYVYKYVGQIAVWHKNFTCNLILRFYG